MRTGADARLSCFCSRSYSSRLLAEAVQPVVSIDCCSFGLHGVLTGLVYQHKQCQRWQMQSLQSHMRKQTIKEHPSPCSHRLQGLSVLSLCIDPILTPPVKCVLPSFLQSPTPTQPHPTPPHPIYCSSPALHLIGH